MPDVSNPPLGISWVELVFSFLYNTQMQIPINIAPKGQQPRYETEDTAPAYDFSSFGLPHVVMSFQRAVDQLQYLSQTQLTPHSGGVRASSLYKLGAGRYGGGFRSRPVMPQQAESMQWLWQYILDNKEGDIVQMTQMPKPPTREPFFVPTIFSPAGDTQQERNSRYWKLRQQIVQSRQSHEGGG